MKLVPAKIMSYFLQLLNAKIDSLVKQERSRKLLVNILSSILVKVVSMVVTLALIPISLNYTEANAYGVFLTISSVIIWFNLFDFGLSSGLTNKLTEAFAKNDFIAAKTYLSTTYFFLALLILPLIALFFIAHYFIDWNAVFNTTIKSSDLRLAIVITFLSFCISFLLKPINHLLKSKQKHFILSIIQVSGNLLALICIYYFGGYFDSKFVFLCAALGISYPIALLVASIVFYSNGFSDIRPNLSDVSSKYFKNVFGISTKFFIIEISVFAILSSNNILIAHLVDNENVTYYNIAHRLFSIITIFQFMIMIPLWPAFTDAYVLKDYKWIESAVARSNKLNFLLCIPLLIMFLFCNTIYEYWIGPSIKIPLEVNLLLVVFVVISLFKETYVSFINGVGRLNLQTLFSVVTILLQLPLAILLTKYFNLGLSGIIILNILWALVGYILWKMQYSVIMHSNKTNKIWY